MSNEEARNRLEWLYEEGHTLSAETKDAIEVAIEALEKQIPKKPVEGYVFAEWLRKRLMEKQPYRANARGSCCPSCGKHIGDCEMILKKKNGHPFCQWCGQRIDWSEESGEKSAICTA